MDSIQYLLRFLFKYAILFFFLAFMWWALATFAPSYSLRALFSFGGSNTEDGGWLPSPRNMKGLFSQTSAPDGQSNVYVPGEAYNGYQNAFRGNQGGSQVDFVTYTASGTQIIHGGVASSQAQPEGAAVSGYSKKELFIRNLSMYEKGHVYTGLTFVGEAKNVMFHDGKFPIIIADPVGRVVSTSYAEATTNWSVPGWVRFQVRIVGVLPVNIPCTMVFEQNKVVNQYQYIDTSTPKPAQPVRVAIPILCN